jgi:hypothetical protein
LFNSFQCGQFLGRLKLRSSCGIVSFHSGL